MLLEAVHAVHVVTLQRAQHYAETVVLTFIVLYTSDRLTTYISPSLAEFHERLVVE